MYEQLGLVQDDIFHKTKLLLSTYRDVVWATLSDCNCINEEIYYYGDDLTDALVYLEEFAPDIKRSEFERRVCNLFENRRCKEVHLQLFNPQESLQVGGLECERVDMK